MRNMGRIICCCFDFTLDVNTRINRKFIHINWKTDQIIGFLRLPFYTGKLMSTLLSTNSKYEKNSLFSLFKK